MNIFGNREKALEDECKAHEKRESELLELCNLYREQLAKAKERDLSGFSRYTVIPVPQTETDERRLQEKVASLLEDPYFLFYISQLRRSIIDAFETSGRDMAEYYRGQLAMVGEIIRDAQRAKKMIGDYETDTRRPD